MRSMHRLIGLVLLLFLSSLVSTQDNNNKENKKMKIAVIGGGIAGTFVTNYLTNYDKLCEVFDSITIFEPHPVNDTIIPNRGQYDTTTATSQQHQYHQSSRIATLELSDDDDDDDDDGSNNKILVELGASILYKSNYLIMDMMRQNSLDVVPPMSTSSSNKEDDNNTRKGFGIYNGYGTWSLLSSTRIPKFLKKFQLLWRYNWDLLQINKICNQAVTKFVHVHSMLDDDNDSFFDSPHDIWETIGLSNAIHTSFDQLLNVVLGDSSSSSTSSWWRNLLPYQGSIRNELLTAINLVNYNQDNEHVNGIVGCGSYVAGLGQLFSIKNGNYQIVNAAFQQAVQNRNEFCKDTTGASSVRMVSKRITTVIGALDGLELFAENDEAVGEFDIVILAAPLQQAGIQFLVPSHFDTAVLTPMPLAGRINAHSSSNSNAEAIPDDNDGHPQLPESVPESALRPYTQVVTTVVSGAKMNITYFGVPDDSQLPRSTLVTAQGKAATFNITAITHLSNIRGGLYKIFSNDLLNRTVLETLFGPSCIIEHVEVWGGPMGGATPDYQGEGTTTNFLLYDGAVGFAGHTSSGALYYPTAMEQCTLASMEIAATGAKAVSKLVAERVGLIERRRGEKDIRDEL